MKDGWHSISGYDVFIENGKVMRGTLGSGTNYRPVYPYKHFLGDRGWYNVSGQIIANAFRYGVKRGFIIML